MYVVRWFANLTKFQILKYEYLLLFTFSWEKESLIGQHFFVGPITIFSVKKKYSFVLQNSRFRQISKSPDDIPRTLFKKCHFGYWRNSTTKQTRKKLQNILKSLFSPKGFHGLRNKTFMCHSELKLRRESKKVGETVTVMVFPAPKASWSQCSQNLFEIARILLA